MPALVWLKRTIRRGDQPAYEAQIWDGPPFRFVVGEGRQREVVAQHVLPGLTMEDASAQFDALKRRYPAPSEPVEA